SGALPSELTARRARRSASILSPLWADRAPWDCLRVDSPPPAYLGPASPLAHHSSMNPDVVAGIARLRRAGILSTAQAALFSRVARRELVSVRVEIRALLYLGVLLLTSGVGIFVVEPHADIGRWAIAASIAAASAACLAWVMRSAPPFSWDEVEFPSV